MLVAACVLGARAGGAVDHTVCPTGCDFPSPAACVVAGAVGPGDRCLVLGGEYHETVEATSGALKLDLIVECAPGESCSIDGDGIRENGFVGYRGWRIRGFEITETVGDAISSIGSTPLAEVSDCFIHDVHGDGITMLGDAAVAQRNVVARVGVNGIRCRGFDVGQQIRNNLVVDAGLLESSSGILCNASDAAATHNTVDLRSRTLEFGDPAPFGILTDETFYNVVTGANVGIQASSASDENLAFGWSSSAYQGVSGPSNATGDPLFFGPADHHLQAGSPAINAAISSVEVEDLEGGPRSGIPDQGAYEYDPSHVELPDPWPIRERVAPIGTGSSVSLSLDEAMRPAVVYVDRDAGRLVYAVRDAQTGSWASETIDAAVDTGAFDDRELRWAALGMRSPGRVPVVAWLERAAGQWELRYAERGGASGDCSDPDWSGCNAAPLATVPDTSQVSLRLATEPGTGRVGVAFRYDTFGGCGGADDVSIVLYEKPLAAAWQATPMAGGCPAAGSVGRGFGLAYAPGSGDAEIAWFLNGALQLAVLPPGGSPSASAVPLDADLPPLGDEHVALGHGPSGTRLAIAYEVDPSALVGSGSGLAVAERVSGVWDLGRYVAYNSDSLLNALGGVAVAYQGEDPVVAFSRDLTLSVAQRLATGDWDSRFVDVERRNGLWASLVVGPQGEILVAQQDGRSGIRDPKLFATGLPAPPPQVPLLGAAARLLLAVGIALLARTGLRRARADVVSRG